MKYNDGGYYIELCIIIFNGTKIEPEWATLFSDAY